MLLLADEFISEKTSVRVFFFRGRMCVFFVRDLHCTRLSNNKNGALPPGARADGGAQLHGAQPAGGGADRARGLRGLELALRVDPLCGRILALASGKPANKRALK